MCEHKGGFIKCVDLIRAETTVSNSTDKMEIKKSLDFIDEHINEVMQSSKCRYFVSSQ